MTMSLSERFDTLSNFCKTKGNQPALIGEKGRLSYEDLGARCQGLYNAMQDAPAGMVLIHGHKELDIVPAMMAATFAGRGFVFADITYPLSRVQQIVETCDCGVVLRTDPLAAQTELTTIDTTTVANTPLQNLRLKAADEETYFYVTFTSGSTGIPKGIPTTRASYAALAGWFEPQNTNAAGGQYAHVNHASMAFDMSMSDIWTTLFAGRPLYLLDHTNTLNPRANIRHITNSTDAPAGGLAATPAFYALMLEDPQFSEKHLPTLLGFWIGGESVPRPLLRDLRSRFPNCEIYHAYGPSEAACITHSQLLSDDDLNSEQPLPLGAPQSGCGVLVKTDDGFKTHGEGEIILVGPQVAACYWPIDHANNTNFGMIGEHRSYNTGDHGHLDADGVMTIHGRIDNQIKVNGFRIELGEIERSAMQVVGVKVAVAMKAQEGCTKGGIILVLSGDMVTEAHIDKVRTHLQRALPPFMVPASIRIEKTLPMSHAGKIDRKSLAQLHASI